MRIFVSTAAVGAIVAAAPAAAQTHAIDVPKGPLAKSIVVLGRQANISIALADPSLSRVPVRAVRGRMTAAQALSRLLAGTPAHFVALGNSTYIVSRRRQPEASRPLPAQRERAAPIAAAPPPQDIVVTASKRRTRLRDYPGPATIVAAGELPLSAGLSGTDALTRQIAALGSTHLGPGRDKIFIRAIADSSFIGQTQATAGQYLGEARLNYNAPDPNLRLYDMALVELLPGPQGTLYGAGTIGGVLRATPAPVELDRMTAGFRASAAATAHGSGSGEIAGMVNLPLAAGRAGLRLVSYALNDGGYIDDAGRGKEDVNRTGIAGARAALRVQMAPEAELELTAVAQRISARDSQYAETAEGELVRRSALAQPFRNSFALANVVLRSNLGAYRLLATGSLSDQSLSETFDATDSADQPLLYRQRNRARLAAGEVRLSSGGGGAAGWLAGVSVVHNKRQLHRAEGPPVQLVDGPALRNAIDEHTLFGEVTYPLAERLKLTAGARVTYVRSRGELEEDEQLSPGVPLRSTAREWQFLPSLALGWNVSDHANAYARYQEGFRPGGAILVAGTTQRLDSDHVAAWEAGFRFRSAVPMQLAGAVSVNYTKWTDVQADLIDNAGFPSTANLGDGDVWSLDAQLQGRLAPRLAAELSAVFSHSRVTNRNPGIIIIDGDPLPNVPRFSGRFGLDYSRQLSPRTSLRLLGWGRYVGRSSLGIGPNLGREQGDYLDTGIEAQWRIGAVTAFVTATNLFDRAGNRFALGSIPSFGSEDQTTPMRPRTLRIGISSGL